jgi:voltage-gated potassium channel
MDSENTIVKNIRYELLILTTTILSLINQVLYIMPLNEEMDNVVRVYEVFISVILLADFLYRLIRASSKTEYFFRKYGWMDLLGSLPIPGMRFFRLLRVIQVIRIIRQENFRTFSRNFQAKRGQAALVLVFFLLIISLEGASLLVLNVEPQAEGANILTASDALWWAYVSITTVGYGDRYPVTNAGRYVGVVLLAVGVGLFSVVTGNLAEVFLSPRRRSNRSRSDDQPEDLSQQLAEINRLLHEQEKVNAELRDKLAKLEQSK